MIERRRNRKQYFDEQAFTTKKYVIPYMEGVMPFDKETSILEIGCGEGGNLEPFVDLNLSVIGVDINEKQIENAKIYLSDHPNSNNLKLIAENIYNVTTEDIGKFDFIMMRDVIEHIPNQEMFMGYIKQFLKPEGKIFFGFPPWQMPFGGHQQGCRSKIGKTLPYYHILPAPIYSFLLKLFGEAEGTIKGLLNTKSTGISIERFEKILKTNQYKIDKKTSYFINPNYEIKFKLKPRKQIPILGSIPYLRNFVNTCVYYIVSEK